MNHKHAKCGCRCSDKEDFDARQAFEELSAKYAYLVEIVATYMSEAGLKRAERSERAEFMADRILSIIGGAPTGEGDFPECCLVGEKRSNGSFFWNCTGVLIHPRAVLTAAHCFDEDMPNIVALRALSKNHLENAQLIGIKNFRKHPQFRLSLGHDLAVLILRSESDVAPVLPADTTEVNSAEQTTLVGFGKDSFGVSGIQREVTVNIRFLRRDASDDLSRAESFFGFESDFEFVAGGNGMATCKGDSGGPAYIDVEGRRKLAGITSRTVATGGCEAGGVYTRVDKNIGFISSVIGSL